MPKCGGSSFRELLEKKFKILEDNEYPIHKTPEKRAQYAKRGAKWVSRADTYLNRYYFTECVHGHFLPYKYSHFYGRDDTLFVTWLRDPIQRLGSHYYFWQRTYQPFRSKPLHKRVIKEEWSLEKFALSEEIRNIYDLYLWKFPLEQFDFVGITEHSEEDMNYFGKRYLDMDTVPIPKENVNPNNNRTYFEDQDLIERVKKFHARDYEIYNQALEMREKRMSM